MHSSAYALELIHSHVLLGHEAKHFNLQLAIAPAFNLEY
jgi:hypothetical protein